MADAKAIREIAERNVKLLRQKPRRGHLTGVTKARLAEGLYCEIEEGRWKLHADMPIKAGGEEKAPTPGMLGRSALASCLVIGIAAWAARRGVAIDSLEVEVQTDFDARGELGIDDNVPPGYREVRYVIAIDSPASDSDLRGLVATAVRYSPYFDVFSRAQPMRRILRLNGKEI